MNKRKVQIHTGEKPYECKECEEHFYKHKDTFTTIEQYQIHKILNSRIKQLNKETILHQIHIGEKRFKCGLCEKLFGDKTYIEKQVGALGSEKNKNKN